MIMYDIQFIIKMLYIPTTTTVHSNNTLGNTSFTWTRLNQQLIIISDIFHVNQGV